MGARSRLGRRSLLDGLDDPGGVQGNPIAFHLVPGQAGHNKPEIERIVDESEVTPIVQKIEFGAAIAERLNLVLALRGESLSGRHFALGFHGEACRAETGRTQGHEPDPRDTVSSPAAGVRARSRAREALPGPATLRSPAVGSEQLFVLANEPEAAEFAPQEKAAPHPLPVLGWGELVA
jgi:hypothetical protein